MTIRELLLQHLPSNEIKQRFNNKQIKINGKVVKNLNRPINCDYYLPLDEWLILHDKKFINKLENLKKIFIDYTLDELFSIKNTNINSNILKYLKAFLILQIDKKTKLILFKN